MLMHTNKHNTNTNTSNMYWLILSILLHTVSATITDLNDVTYYEHVAVHHIDRHGRNRRSLSTRDGDRHLEETSFVFIGHGRRFHLQLNKNEKLLHPSFSVIYQNSDGTSRQYTVVDHCYYHGHVIGRNNSSAVVNTCYGLSGVVTDDDGVEFIVQPFPPTSDKTTTPESYVLFKSTDVVEKDGASKCGNDHSHDDDDDGNISTSTTSKMYNFTVKRTSHDEDERRKHRDRRSTTSTFTKYIEVIVVLDNLFLMEFNMATQKAEHRALDIFNIVDSKFKVLSLLS